jgi:hypothetical protein
MANKAALSAVADAVAIISPKLTATVVTLFKNEEKKIAVIRADQDKAIQAALDAMLLACDRPKAEWMKGNAVHNPARRQIKAMFDSIVGPNTTQNTANAYGSCFWIAFEKGIPFSRDLANKKSAAKKDGETKTENAKSGKVETTDIPALHKTLSKALAQARLLNQSIFAADLVDLITDTWPDFKETVLSK